MGVGGGGEIYLEEKWGLITKKFAQTWFIGADDYLPFPTALRTNLSLVRLWSHRLCDIFISWKIFLYKTHLHKPSI